MYGYVHCMYRNYPNPVCISISSRVIFVYYVCYNLLTCTLLKLPGYIALCRNKILKHDYLT